MGGNYPYPYPGRSCAGFNPTDRLTDRPTGGLMQNGSEPSAEACQAARRRLIEKRRKKRHARKVHPYSARIGARGHTTDSPSPSEKIIKLRKAYDAALTCGASKTDLRRIRNRLSAAISRENKEQKLVQLAEQSSNLRKANSLLRRRLAVSEHEVASLKAALLLAQQSNHNNKDTLKLSNQSDSLSTDSAEIGEPVNGPNSYRTSLLEIRNQRDLTMKVWTLMYLMYASMSSQQPGLQNALVVPRTRRRPGQRRRHRARRRRRPGIGTRRENVNCRVSIRKRSPHRYLIQYSIKKTVLISTPSTSAGVAEIPPDKANI